MTYQRRSAGKGSATVTFQDGIKVTAKKDAFLANPENKNGSLPFYNAIYQKVAVARCKLRVMQMFLSSKQRSTLP